MVSVCIPTYNKVELFKRCLDSVLMQDFKDYEIVVSDDSTNEAIHDHVKKLDLKNLVYVHNNHPLGSPENWNNAMAKASRKYIKILHHDDYFTGPDSLSKFIHALEKESGACFAFCYSRIHFKKQQEFFIHKQTRNQLKRLEKEPEFLLFRNVIGAPSAVIFRNDPELLFNRDYKWLVDVEFYIRYLKKHPSFVTIPEPLITVVDGEQDQVTQQVSDNKMIVIPEHLQLFSSLYHEKLKISKAILFFQELFVRFGIMSLAQLRSEFKVPENLEPFLTSVFEELSHNTLWKAFKKRILTSRYNKQIFKIERF